MRISVTVAAVAYHAALAAVALVAGRRIVPPSEWESSTGVVEALPCLPRAHLPTRWGVTVSAIDPLRDRVVAARLGTSRLLFGIFGDSDPCNPGEDGNAKHDAQPAAHRWPFLRACGLP
jgi:hypothetical protein